MLHNASAMGELLERRLGDLMQSYPFIGDVRGKGLLLAFELVAERERMTPLPAELKAYDRLVNLAYERGLIIYSRRTRDGIEGDHFLVCPPMIVTEEQIDEIIDMLRASLDALAAELGLPTA
jgi:4-aminobutyrate aminotransferase-like enzyme